MSSRPASGPAPRKEDLRAALIGRAEAFARLRGGLALSYVSRLADGDGNFLAKVRNGQNFTVDRYERCMDWFDENWPKTAAAAAGAR